MHLLSSLFQKKGRTKCAAQNIFHLPVGFTAFIVPTHTVGFTALIVPTHTVGFTADMSILNSG